MPTNLCIYFACFWSKVLTDQFGRKVKINCCPLIWMFSARSLNNSLNYIHESYMLSKNLECITKEIYKFHHGLAPPIMKVFQIRENVYKLRNFQAFFFNNKEIVKFGTETVTYRGPQISNSIPENIKNVVSLEVSKRNLKSEKTKHGHVGFVKLTYKTSVLSRHKH